MATDDDVRAVLERWWETNLDAAIAEPTKFGRAWLDTAHDVAAALADAEREGGQWRMMAGEQADTAIAAMRERDEANAKVAAVVEVAQNCTTCIAGMKDGTTCGMCHRCLLRKTLADLPAAAQRLLDELAGLRKVAHSAKDTVDTWREGYEGVEDQLASLSDTVARVERAALDAARGKK